MTSDAVSSAPAPGTARDLADRLVGFTVDRIEEIVAHHVPDLVLPRTFAGHRVASDVPADLVFTLGHLKDAGVDAIAGRPIDDAIVRVLEQVDGPSTHSFFSYRVAETIGRYGPFSANPLLDRFDAAGRANLAEACDSSSFLPLLDTVLPVNYAAVLARCELARERLGILPDPAVLDDLIARVVARLAGNPYGFLDDSHDHSHRYDMYTPDVYLFLEPLAERLGVQWHSGAQHAADLVARVAASDGTAIAWGRSSGALAGALTIELSALVLRHGLGRDPGGWLARGANALDHYGRWFHRGVITAHQHRSTYDYRGPFRRLQMTFDILGKLAYAAATLRACEGGDHVAVPPLADRDTLIAFDERAAVWTYRADGLAFVVPFVGGPLSDYLAAPRHPGTFEVPVDSDQACFVPVAFAGAQRFAPVGVPSTVVHTAGAVEVEHRRFLPMTRIDADHSRLPGPMAVARRARLWVEGRALHGEEHLSFERAPDALALLVPEVEGRPLRVALAADAPHRVDAIDVMGLKEWRSYWHRFATVHQLDVEPRNDVHITWSVEPKLRVGVNSRAHHYVRSIYDHLNDRVWSVDAVTADAAGFDVDQMHVHWPEWAFFIGADLHHHEQLIADLQRRTIRIVWTQHNLTPHAKQPELYDPIYAAWAAASDAAIHHTAWGRDRVLERYAFAPGCRHAVIPHPHFGALEAGTRPTRAEAEAALGLPPAAVRLGIVGAPRAEKDLAYFAEGFAASARRDAQLVIWSLGPGDTMPDDPRIIAHPYAMVDRATYELRLAACDALVLPFEGHDMLATGTAADAVGLGLPALTSSWPFLAEYLGDAAIPYGSSRAEIAACVDALDAATLQAAAAASRALQARYAPEAIADATFALLDAVGTARP